LPFLEPLRRSPRMTDRRMTGLPADNESALADFHVEVARLMSLSQDAFAVLDPDALPSIVATIRATSSQAPAS
jgi:hypothetical protein